jgi:DNA repair protein SbcD/Mre11
MRLLHTSDWHIGRLLYGRRRYQEFEAFFDWLAATVEAEAIDLLLVAGDIFDTALPSHRAQTIYYRFLHRIATSNCRHLVVIGGNHDSPTLLDAPRALLQALDLHVVGSITDDLNDEVIVLHAADGTPLIIVCAVPYLRDSDIRTATAGESIEDKDRQLVAGITRHYADVAALAVARREALGVDIPIVAMGHLFAAGGKTIDGDGVRELYVGSLARLSAAIFDPCFDYVALGHLHVAQAVKGGATTICYSGSPLPIGFGEAAQAKSVTRIDLRRPQVAEITLINVPTFQSLLRLVGDQQQITQRLQMLVAERSRAWLEITHQSSEIVADLREQLEAIIAGSELEILSIKDPQRSARLLAQVAGGESLDELDPEQVFLRLLYRHEIDSEQQSQLLAAYREILHLLQHTDHLAE